MGMEEPITDSETLSEAPPSFVPTDEVWAEVSFSGDGVGVTLYNDSPNGPKVLDETWLTHEEIERKSAEDENISLSG